MKRRLDNTEHRRDLAYHLEKHRKDIEERRIIISALERYKFCFALNSCPKALRLLKSSTSKNVYNIRLATTEPERKVFSISAPNKKKYLSVRIFVLF